MRAFADEAQIAGYHLYTEPALLATFYNAWKLDEVHHKFLTKKYPSPLAVNETMGAWVRDNLPYLERAIGKPSAIVVRPKKKPKTKPEAKSSPARVAPR